MPPPADDPLSQPHRTFKPQHSAGNHALALSWHGSQLGIPVHVFMPVVAPLAKVDKCRRFGANVVITGAHIGEAKDFAQSNPEYHGRCTFVCVWVERGGLRVVDRSTHASLLPAILESPPLHHQASSTSTATTTRRSWRARAPSASRCWSRSHRPTTSSSPSGAPVRGVCINVDMGCVDPTHTLTKSSNPLPTSI